MPSLLAQYRRLSAALGQRIRLPEGFARVFIALAVLSLGLLDLARLFQSVFSQAFTLGALLSLSDTVFSDIIHGAPRVIAGAFLVMMSLGLYLRSRLAWVISVATVALSVALSLVLKTLPFNGVSVYGVVVLILLLAGRRHFQKSSLAATSLFAATSLASLLIYAAVGSYILGDQFSPNIRDIGSAAYFVVVTMSTVGYGDVTPRTPEARLFVVSIILLGVTVFATSLSALLVPMVTRRAQILNQLRGRFMKHSDHFIITSQSALARNTSKELRQRGKHVILIVDGEDGSQTRDLGHTDVVTGDPSSLDVLKRAHGQTAKAVLALSDDDAANAFVVLAAKELGDGVRTVTVVNDARNLERIRRVRPDLIIAPTILGGELLAMTLSGERPTGDDFLNRLLQGGI